MDKERRKKIQTIRLIITEIFMLIIIVLTVIILTFVVMGYHLNEDGKLEQSGLVQVDSIPTGATVTVGDETLQYKTNTNKILPEGDYTVKIEKDGFSSWSKTVAVHPGFLTKLSYPRLYKLERKVESVKNLDSSPVLFSTPENRSNILFAYKNSPKFVHIDISGSSPKITEINLEKLLPKDLTETNLKILAWSKGGERVILSFTKDAEEHLEVIDLEHPEYSLDLTEFLGVKISKLSFITDYGDKLFVLENGRLHTFSLSDKELSKSLIDNVLSFSNSGQKATLVVDGSPEKEIQFYDNNDNSFMTLEKTTAKNVLSLFSEYIGRFTFAFLEDNELTVYRSDLPVSETPLKDPVGKVSLAFQPTTFEMTAKNQVILTSSNTDFTIFDLENYTPSSYSLENSLTFWPDEYTIGVVSDGHLIFRDFDGNNRLSLSPAESGFSAIISKDDNYLYYVIKNSQEKLEIVRENIK